MKSEFTNEENELIRLILSEVVIKDRTGEVGIIHGADRFISTNICIKKKQREVLASVFKKLGISNPPREVAN